MADAEPLYSSSDEEEEEDLHFTLETKNNIAFVTAGSYSTFPIYFDKNDFLGGRPGITAKKFSQLSPSLQVDWISQNLKWKAEADSISLSSSRKRRRNVRHTELFTVEDEALIKQRLIALRSKPRQPDASDLEEAKIVSSAWRNSQIMYEVQYNSGIPNRWLQRGDCTRGLIDVWKKTFSVQPFTKTTASENKKLLKIVADSIYSKVGERLNTYRPDMELRGNILFVKLFTI